MAVGGVPTATGGRTSVVIDATADPGVELLASFLPAAPATGGQRRAAATQIVTANVSIAFDAVLPLYWLASVLRVGDIAPNRLAQPYTAVSDDFAFAFGEVTVTHSGGAWQAAHFDSRAYRVDVGFGIGPGGLTWGYSVPCQPGQTIHLDAGSYQFVRSDGQAGVGDTIPDDLEVWAMPLGFAYSLVFDQCGYGVLTTVTP